MAEQDQAALWVAEELQREAERQRREKQKQNREATRQKSLAFNIRLIGIEQADKPCAEIVQALFQDWELDFSKVHVEGWGGTGRFKYIRVRCLNGLTKKRILALRGSEVLQQVKILEDLTPNQERDLTVYVNGVMELEDELDDMYTLRYIFDNLALSKEEWQRFVDDVYNVERYGKEEFGKSRKLGVTFNCRETKNLLLKRNVFPCGDFYFYCEH